MHPGRRTGAETLPRSSLPKAKATGWRHLFFRAPSFCPDRMVLHGPTIYPGCRCPESGTGRVRVAYSTSPRSTNIPSIVITSDRTGGGATNLSSGGGQRGQRADTKGLFRHLKQLHRRYTSHITWNGSGVTRSQVVVFPSGPCHRPSTS